jgi:hypothetical protein
MKIKKTQGNITHVRPAIIKEKNKCCQRVGEKGALGHS